MLGKSRKQWANINPALGQRLVLNRMSFVLYPGCAEPDKYTRKIENAVSANFTSKQILPFGFAQQHRRGASVPTLTLAP